MKVAIFAHYDSQNIIEDYVIYYLKELKKIANKIVFVSDCELDNKEKEKISPFTDAIIAKRHNEYDFGSYKYGYLYAKENNLLNDCKELIFANDSCIGPLKPFSEIWDKMQNKKCDFWGITKNGIVFPLHVQSYFLVFKENVFKSEIFDNFICKISKEENKQDVITKYEIGLSVYLKENGFNFETYYHWEIPQFVPILVKNINEDIPMFKKNMLHKIHFPILNILLNRFIKRNNYTYPIENIKKYHKNKAKPKISRTLKAIRKMIFRFSLKEGYIIILGNSFNLKKCNDK